MVFTVAQATIHSETRGTGCCAGGSVTSADTYPSLVPYQHRQKSALSSLRMDGQAVAL